MVVVSKLHTEGLQFRTCSELIHSGPCITNSARNTYKFLLSNVKYFAPIILLPLFVKIRKLDKNAWKVFKDTLKHYVECVLVGVCSGWAIQVLICVFRNLFGEFRYWFIVFAPTAIGISLSLFASQRTYKFFQTSIFQTTIESILMQRKNVITKAITGSLPLQAVIFMCCSACILHGKQRNLYRGFWFLTPSTKAPREAVEQKEQEENTKLAQEVARQCAHEETSCGLYLVRGVRTYLAVGLTLDTIKMLMEKTPTGTVGFISKLWAKICNFRVNTTAFFASYVGLYRFTHCYLNRRFPATNTELNNCIAGFFAGACYIFLPKLTLFAYAIMLSTETLWKMLDAYDQQQEQSNCVLRLVRQLPISKTLYPFSVGYLVHTYCYRRRYISSLGDAIVNGLTNNYARKINGKFQQIERLMEEHMKDAL